MINKPFALKMFMFPAACCIYGTILNSSLNDVLKIICFFLLYGVLSLTYDWYYRLKEEQEPKEEIKEEI